MVHFTHTNFTSLSKPNYTGYIERTTSHSLFMASTINLCEQLYPRIFSSDIKRPDSLGTVNFMRIKSHQVNAIFVNIYRNLANSLCCVRKNQYSSFLCHGTDFLNRHHSSNFIVGKHDRNQNCRWLKRCLQFSKINQPVVANAQIGY